MLVIELAAADLHSISSQDQFGSNWSDLRALSMADSPLCSSLLGILSVFWSSSPDTFKLQRSNSSWQFLTLSQMLPLLFTHNLPPTSHLLSLGNSVSSVVAKKMGRVYLLQCPLDLLKVRCIIVRTTEGPGCFVNVSPAFLSLSLSQFSIFWPKLEPSKSTRLLSTQVTNWCQYSLLASVPYI